MAKKIGNVIGSWAFLIGFILAILLGLFGVISPTSVNSTWVAVLVVIGIIVGLLNIADEEASPFLMSGTVLIIASSLGQGIVGALSMLDGVLMALSAIFVPATIIVAIKNVFSFAKN